MKIKNIIKNKYHPKEKYKIGKNLKAINTKTKPVKNSTKGYWCEIFIAQRRHLPD